MWQPAYSGEVSGRDHEQGAQEPGTPEPWTRRRLLGVGLMTGVGLTALASGCSLDQTTFPDLPVPGRRARPGCVARSSLPRYDELAGLPLVYEVNRRRDAFAIEEGFAGQLESWLADLIELTGWKPEQLWTYGTWTDGGSSCSSWHNSGRALDLARLRLADGTDVSCRYDQWRDASGRELTGFQRTYWALAASAHKHFAYVLTYLYNAEHHNHIHLDNGSSGSELSTFRSRSRAQVQAVQGILTHLWDVPVEITNRYDAATRDATRTVLDRLDLRGDLTDQSTWTAFLTASIRQGAQSA